MNPNFSHQEIARLRYAEVIREARYVHATLPDEAPDVELPHDRQTLQALRDRLSLRRRLALLGAVGA